jgi:hypothetical protein
LALLISQRGALICLDIGEIIRSHLPLRIHKQLQKETKERQCLDEIKPLNDITIRVAIKLFFENKNESNEIYGPIGYWDVSQVTI